MYLVGILYKEHIMIFYIYIEARPKGSHFIADVKETIARFFRSR